MIDRKFHLIDALTGGAVYSPENAEAELEAYVQERTSTLREALEVYTRSNRPALAIHALATVSAEEGSDND